MKKYLRLQLIVLITTTLQVSAAESEIVPRAGTYKSVPYPHDCGKLVVSKVGLGFPGILIVKDNSGYVVDGDTGQRVWHEGKRSYPLPNLGPVRPLGNWDRRTVFNRNDCFQLNQEIAARDPSDYGYWEEPEFCYDSDANEIKATYDSSNICTYRLAN